jgi:hypothetical protein
VHRALAPVGALGDDPHSVSTRSACEEAIDGRVHRALAPVGVDGPIRHRMCHDEAVNHSSEGAARG